MNQKELFPKSDDYEDRPEPAQWHSPTSVAAAEEITPHAGKLRYRVYQCLHASEDGLTDEELARRLVMRQETARARRIGLMHDGLVADSGRTRPTSSGRAAVVWVVKDNHQPAGIAPGDTRP